MMDQTELKNIAHDDQAFQELISTNGEEVLETLQEMYMKASTQIAKYGDERKDWFKKVTSFTTLLEFRIAQTEKYILLESHNWKRVLKNFAIDLFEAGHGAEMEPNWDLLEDVENWLSTVEL